MTPQLARATLVKVNPDSKQPAGTDIVVDFNPQSLQLQYAYTGKEGSAAQQKGSKAQQTNQRTDYSVTLSSLSLSRKRPRLSPN